MAAAVALVAVTGTSLYLLKYRSSRQMAQKELHTPDKQVQGGDSDSIKRKSGAAF
ncbi:hypothetical protein [Chitinophaga pinensis]|uniref:hypothetical protein n=1 Tax=Chitinophaga pinensis TaxID=79329 RepID=UPI001645B9B8|nr:hypothetical protein [Chitinophaga pinensis]